MLVAAAGLYAAGHLTLPAAFLAVACAAGLVSYTLLARNRAPSDGVVPVADLYYFMSPF